MVSVTASDPRYEELDSMAQALCLIANRHMLRLPLDMPESEVQALKKVVVEQMDEYMQSEDFE